MKKNILLVGMPGTGKSTLGKLLSEKKGLQFVDVDAMIDASANMPPQEILDSLGDEGFCKLEASALDSIQGDGLVIATGGSAIYQKPAIAKLKLTSLVIHLRAASNTLLERIKDFDQRAVVRAKNLSFAELYAERMPLYQAVTDIDFDTDQPGLTVDTAVQQLIALIDASADFSWMAHSKIDNA